MVSFGLTHVLRGLPGAPSKARVAGESPLDGEEVVKKLISSAFQKVRA